MLNSYEKSCNAERKLQLVYWLVENLKANEEDEALITNLNLIQNLCNYTLTYDGGMYKTLLDNWDKIEENNITSAEELLPLYYGSMYN